MRMLLGTQMVNKQGHLEIGGVDTVELAREFGTPLYVMDETHIRRMCREYVSCLKRYHRGPIEVVFAGKAFLCLAMCKIVEQEGLSLDVSSAGELYTALKADFPPERIHLHGNNKSDEELTMALDAGVGRIIIDSLQEIEQIERLANGRAVDVLLRLTPGIKAKTHSYIQTAQLDVKFGLGIGSSQAREGVARILQSDILRLRGFHCHIGSQLFGLDCYRETVRVMFDFMAEMHERTGYVAEQLNLGGGLGVRYVVDDHPPTVDEFCAAVGQAVEENAARVGYELPQLLLEPGRSIVGEAGVTLYTAGVVKEIPGVRTYVSVDGGMSDNPRPALYQAEYEIIVANKASWEPSTIVTIAGKHCETDVLITDVMAPPIEPGDIIAVQTTGAYTYSMASNYNRLPRPGVVLVGDGRAELIVRRETLDDVIAHDVIPERLARG